MGEILDDETKAIVIKKTWCHGQLIAPLYGFLCLYWAVSSGTQDPRLWLAALVMPCWSYLSWRAISSAPSYNTLLYGGIVAELCHVGVFSVAVQHTKDTLGLLLTIASGLFFIETAAFLGVVTWLRPTLEQQQQSRSMYDPMR